MNRYVRGLMLGLTPFSLGILWVYANGTVLGVLAAFLFGISCGVVGTMATDREFR